MVGVKQSLNDVKMVCPGKCQLPARKPSFPPRAGEYAVLAAKLVGFACPDRGNKRNAVIRQFVQRTVAMGSRRIEFQNIVS